jgi:glycosyltransferase involved in cell wall biosynthesis
MAAARPVVVTDVGGASEAVIAGETGYLVAAGDDEQMAARIIELLRAPERARAMGERGRLVVAEKFSCERHLANTLELYSKLLSKEFNATKGAEFSARVPAESPALPSSADSPASSAF